MRSILLSGLIVTLVFGGQAGLALPVAAQVDAGVVIDRDGLRHFHLAIGDYYGMPHTTVARVHTRSVRLHPEELPVVFFMAREARVSPETVIALRMRGWSWVDVSAHLGISPALFLTHLPVRRGPPYGKAHGYWKKRDARHLRLSDREIIDFVNLRFISDYYRRPAQEVIVLRDRGRSYIEIQGSYRRSSPSSRTAVRAPTTHREPTVPQPRAAPTRSSTAVPSTGRVTPPPAAGSRPPVAGNGNNGRGNANGRGNGNGRAGGNGRGGGPPGG